MNQEQSSSEQPQQKPKIFAVIPCFNEERFIGSVVLKTKKYADSVIVIDDGSTDETAEVAEAAGALVIKHKENQGKGAAINTAFEQARKNGWSVLVLLDGDGQHDPADIPSLLQPVLKDEADVVVGSRWLESNGQTPSYRRTGQRVLNFATNMSSQVKLTDSQSGFRAFSHKAIQVLSFKEKGLSVESEMQFLISEKGLKVAEVPIDVSYMEKAKRNPVRHGVSVLNRLLVLSSLRNPLLLFGVPGLALLLCGLILGARVLTIYSNTHELAIGTTLGTILLCLAGLLALFAALMLLAMKELLPQNSALLSEETNEHTQDSKFSSENR